MARVFNDKPRTSLAPRRPGKGLYAYYDESGRFGFDRYREIVNCWVAELPPDEQAEVITRMRSGNDQQFEAALVELTAHAMFIRLGYQPELHPTVPNSTRCPDFLVRNAAGSSLFYTEATTINPAEDEVAHDNREAALYNAINGANIPPDLRLGYALLNAGTSSPKLIRLIAKIEAWAKDNAESSRSPRA